MKVEGIQYYLTLIEEENPEFKDDGLSGGFPDWMYYRWKLGLAGRVHDWHYCGRCHPAGTMDLTRKKFADKALRKHAKELLPWWLPLAPYILYFGVWIGGGLTSWNSCGPTQGVLCRHNITISDWMVFD